MIVIIYTCLALLHVGLTAWVLGVAAKTGLLEWAQVHAPSELLYKLLTCRFCTTFWAGVVIALIAAISTRSPELIALPLFTTQFTKQLW